MQANLGQTDRILRAVLGAVLITASIFYGSWFLLAGGIIILTSALSWCPIYAPFGWSTKNKTSHV